MRAAATLPLALCLLALNGLQGLRAVQHADAKLTAAKLTAAKAALRRLHPLRPANATSARQPSRRPRARGGTVHFISRTGEVAAHRLWLRYTHPRADTVALPLHGDETVVQSSLQQPLDHLDPDNSVLWTQTYYRNQGSHEAGGPAFVMLTGTEDYAAARDWLKEGQMADLARAFKADRFLLPTRFFAASGRPTADSSRENLYFLNVEQVLQDVIAFLEHLLEKGDLAQDQKVVLFGAGFGGAIATWARMQFPTVVSGVVASSPTLEAKYDTFSYFPVVTAAVNWYHRKDLDCEPALREAFTSLEAALNSREGRADFNEHFQPCSPLPVEQSVAPDDRAHILGLVAGAFADAVQEDEDGPNEYGRPGGDKLAPLCYVLAQAREDGGAPLSALGLLTSQVWEGRCLDASFQGLVAALASPDWASDANQMGLRQWLWLQCTELGQLPTSTSTQYTFPYSLRISMTFYKKVCAGAFGEGVTDSLPESLVNLKANYGGKRPQISHAIFVRADLDPWKDLGPDEDLAGDEVHVFSVKRASHAHDMFPREDFDPPWMKRTRKAITSVLAGWLSQG